MKNSQERLKKLTIRFWASIFLMFVMIIAGIILFSNFLYNFQVLALSPNYSKGTNGTLTANEWNTLNIDFVPQPIGCNNGQAVQWSGGNWICASGGGLGQPDFNSQWIAIANDQTMTLVFNTVQPGNTLTGSNQDFFVELRGSENADGSNSHISALGSETSDQSGMSGWVSNGAHWFDLTDSEISVRRQGTPEGRIINPKPWNFFRVRIWDTTP